jgi:hypothetical protein
VRPDADKQGVLAAHPPTRHLPTASNGPKWPTEERCFCRETYFFIILLVLLGHKMPLLAFRLPAAAILEEV